MVGIKQGGISASMSWAAASARHTTRPHAEFSGCIGPHSVIIGAAQHEACGEISSHIFQHS